MFTLKCTKKMKGLGGVNSTLQSGLKVYSMCSPSRLQSSAEVAYSVIG
jgi:hypothetical protein